MIGKKKYELYFEINEQGFNEILNNPVENKKFKEKIKQKISKDYNISKDKILDFEKSVLLLIKKIYYSNPNF